MLRLPHSLTKAFAITTICVIHQPTAIAKAFSWHIDRNGDLVTVPVDARPASTSDPSRGSQPASGASVPSPARTPPAPEDDIPQTASALGLILGILLSGSGYICGRRLYRRLRGDQAPHHPD